MSWFDRQRNLWCEAFGIAQPAASVGPEVRVIGTNYSEDIFRMSDGMKIRRSSYEDNTCDQKYIDAIKEYQGANLALIPLPVPPTSSALQQVLAIQEYMDNKMAMMQHISQARQSAFSAIQVNQSPYGAQSIGNALGTLGQAGAVSAAPPVSVLNLHDQQCLEMLIQKVKIGVITDGQYRQAVEKIHRDSQLRANATGFSAQTGSIGIASGAGGIFTSTGAAASIVLAEPPDEPLENIGIVAGEIIGYRMWRVDQGVLKSGHVGTLWYPGQVLEGKPGTGSEGIYAFKTIAQVDEALNDYPAPDGAVIGSVEMWGEIVEHETGYRAQFARIKTLDQYKGPHWKDNPLAVLRSVYGLTA